ncbi:MAG TPA: outer membrane beta-barrel domain-containing protein [Steroidobacteraceae bacterium]|nr:outer membrane beta-barrel domain-containing protein [Steroidobacteraceae bacterium]
MESRIRIFLLTASAALALASLPATAVRAADADPAADSVPSGDTEEQDQPPVIEPEVERRKVKVPKIDRENFEIGVFGGVINVEDFDANPSYGLRLAYHISEDFFTEATIGQTTVSRNAAEIFFNFDLTRGERQFTYYDVSFGYNFLPGEMFVGRKRAFNTALYVTAGVGGTRFAGDDEFTIALGVGYRMLVSDWLALHLDVRDHAYRSSLLGLEKVAHNLDANIGFTVFF